MEINRDGERSGGEREGERWRRKSEGDIEKGKDRETWGSRDRKPVIKRREETDRYKKLIIVVIYYYSCMIFKGLIP